MQFSYKSATPHSSPKIFTIYMSTFAIIYFEFTNKTAPKKLTLQFSQINKKAIVFNYGVRCLHRIEMEAKIIYYMNHTVKRHFSSVFDTNLDHEMFSVIVILNILQNLHISICLGSFSNYFLYWDLLDNKVN